MGQRWLLLDFPSIKGFVFGTERAREIRGASGLLDSLNDSQLRAFLEEHLPDAKTEVIFAGGGGALLRFDDVAEEDIKGCMERFAAKVRKTSGGGLRFEYACLEDDGRSFSETMLALRQELEQQRYGAMRSYPQVHTGILRSCSSCSTGHASVFEQYDPEEPDRGICLSCDAKQRFDDKNSEGSTYHTWIESYDDPDLRVSTLRPPSFADISHSKAARPGYIALIYGDGDSMGKIIKDMDTKEQYAEFSQVVDGCLKEATREVLSELFPEPGAFKWLPVDILLLGGDDLVMVIDAEYALPFVLRTARLFQSKTREKLPEDFFHKESKEQGLSVSFGVAFMKLKQPFRIVLDQAEALLSSAKRARAEEGSSAPFVDVADVSQSRYVDLESLRKEDLGVGQAIEWTGWPRSLEKAEEFYGISEQLKQGGLTRGHIHGLTEAALLPGGRAGFEVRRWLTRLPSSGQGSTLRRDMVRFFNRLEMRDPPWQQLEDSRKRTAVLDLAGLYPYLPSRP